MVPGSESRPLEAQRGCPFPGGPRGSPRVVGSLKPLLERVCAIGSRTSPAHNQFHRVPATQHLKKTVAPEHLMAYPDAGRSS